MKEAILERRLSGEQPHHHFSTIVTDAFFYT
jgi:hypothetical protein